MSTLPKDSSELYNQLVVLQDHPQNGAGQEGLPGCRVRKLLLSVSDTLLSHSEDDEGGLVLLRGGTVSEGVGVP